MDFDAWDDTLLRDVAASPSTGGSFQGWALNPMTISTLADTYGVLQNLEALVANDDHLEWQDIHPFFRLTAAVYDSHVIGMPYSSNLFLFYYRRDILDAANLPVPNTWDEVLATAAALHGSDLDGDDQPEYGFCFPHAPACPYTAFALAAVWSPHTVTQGRASGLSFDSSTMTPLTNNSAMAEALSVIRQLKAFGAPSDPAQPCNGDSEAFSAGRCALSLAPNDAFKHAMLASAKLLRGRIGTAPMPGATRVLDRATAAAAGADIPTKTSMLAAAPRQPLLVNRAPFLGYGALSVGINRRASPAEQLAAYRSYVWAMDPEVAWERVLTVSAVREHATRNEHLDPANLPKYVAAGFDAADVTGIQRTYVAAMEHPNAQLVLRTHAAVEVLQAMQRHEGVEVLQAMQAAVVAAVSTSLPVETIMGSLTAAISAIYGHFKDPDRNARLRRSYHTLQGYTADSATKEQPPSPAAAQTKQPQHKDRGPWLPCGLHKALHLPPVHGPLSTLVVTDLQDSTPLWEDLSPLVMQQAMRLHDTIVRGLLRKHNGFEAATEGDAYILAFHTPQAAAAFALAAQAELLTAPWPEALLGHPSARVVTLREVVEAAAAAAQSVSGHHPRAERRPASHRLEGPPSLTGMTPAAPVLSVLCSGEALMLPRMLSTAPQLNFNFQFSSPADSASGPRDARPASSGLPPLSSRFGGGAATPTGGGGGGGGPQHPFDDVDEERSRGGELCSSLPTEWHLHLPLSRSGRAGPRAAALSPAEPSGSHTSGGVDPWDTVSRAGSGSVAAKAPGDEAWGRAQVFASALLRLATKGKAEPAAQQQQVLLRGLRMRIGLATGIGPGSSVVLAGLRPTYGGLCLQAVKAVCDAGQGSMVFMNEAAYAELSVCPPAGAPLLAWHEGTFLLVGLEAPLQVYQLCSPDLQARLPYFQMALGRQLRSGIQLLCGVTGALTGPAVAVALLDVVGMAGLFAWNERAGSAALALLRDIAAVLVRAAGGCAFATPRGCGAAFASAALGVQWALELYEPVLVDEELVHRGLRVRGAVHCGSVAADPSLPTCDVLYLGHRSGALGTALEALRKRAKTGTVLCSAAIAAAYSAMDPLGEGPGGGGGGGGGLLPEPGASGWQASAGRPLAMLWAAARRVGPDPLSSGYGASRPDSSGDMPSSLGSAGDAPLPSVFFRPCGSATLAGEGSRKPGGRVRRGSADGGRAPPPSAPASRIASVTALHGLEHSPVPPLPDKAHEKVVYLAVLVAPGRPSPHAAGPHPTAAARLMRRMQSSLLA
ncbi:hypothetical protein HYH03_009208 [Edaphochlamys debaryana]|uniref:Guanylate cyclase domain-containing protein n=1 Tax=Edaphochlamys debaryana TaxID=47281 RepID=A0A835XYF5_9CHLO|nr:hypothetical protein HYH03_009208 [Edaphochlamys debaryana]|eukprot:KAG2492543.1 hypothetical protein HYH03_009208 [Edaphochlamys debaryana]